MRSRLSRRLGYLAAASIVLFGTTGVLVGTGGVPFAASAACACEGGGEEEGEGEKEHKEKEEKEAKEHKEKEEKESKEKKEKEKDGKFPTAELKFGTVTVGKTLELSAELEDQKVSGTVTPGAAKIKPGTSGIFKIMSDGCSGVKLSYTNTCKIKVKFAPAAVAKYSETLETPLVGSDGTKESAQELLIGEGS
jgi:hypothetical protein